MVHRTTVAPEQSSVITEQSMTWQPIEKAPKEGRILGYSRADGQHVWWWVRHIIPGGADRGSWENISYESYELTQPTHWMPLPAPPTGQP